MSQNRQDLKNPELYDELIYNYERTVPEALIYSNNGSKLKDLDHQEIFLVDKKLREGKGQYTSLFEDALVCKELEAIKVLVDAKLVFPDDDMALKRYLNILFTQRPNIRSIVDKSASNLIAIHDFLQKNLFNNHPAWSDTETMNSLVVTAARNGEIKLVEALLKVDIINNVTVPDETGKTALYYVSEYLSDSNENKKEDEIIANNVIEALKLRGAVLSPADNLAIKNMFATNLILAIEQHDHSVINDYLTKVHQEKSVLSPSLLEKCLDTAIHCDDIETVQSLLRCDLAQQSSLRNLSKPKTLEMAYAMAATYQKKGEDVQFELSQMLKKYAHRIGVSGTISVGHENEQKLEGSSSADSGIALREILAEYSSKVESFKPFYDAVSFYSNVRAIHSVRNKIFSESLCFKHYLAGNMMLLPTGWNKHGLGIGIKYDISTNKTYVSVSNRGEGGVAACLTEGAKNQLNKNFPPTGTVVYELDGMLDPSFFTKMNNLDLGWTFNNDGDFNKELNNQLKNATPVAVLPAESQSHGTCSYVNQKRAIEGLIVIEAICEGKRLDKETLDDAYNKYISFAVYDRKQAVRGLITDYLSITKNPDSNPMEVSALNKFMMMVILEHHSTKYNEIDSARELFNILPETLQVQLSRIAPELALKPEIQKEHLTLFSAQRGVRDIKITGNTDAILAYSDTLNKLLEFLRENNISSKEVTRIEVEKDKITVRTAEDRSLKYHLRDEIFKKKLGADVVNVEGYYAFVVKNPDKIPGLSSRGLRL